MIKDDSYQRSEIRFVQFIYPALCDFTQNLLFIFGLGMVLPSMSIATKAVALPISAFFCKWSLLKIRKSFNMKQIMALIGIMVSVLLIFIISSSKDLSSDGTEAIKKEQEMTTGLIMLGLSACFQAFEVCLENRLFMIEPALTALNLQQAVASWKLILVSILTFVGNFIFPILGEAMGSDSKGFDLYFKNINEEKSLYWLMAALMFVNALQANLGMQVVKNENAVFKQSTILLSIPTLWLFHITASEANNED